MIPRAGLRVVLASLPIAALAAVLAGAAACSGSGDPAATATALPAEPAPALDAGPSLDAADASPAPAITRSCGPGVVAPGISDCGPDGKDSCCSHAAVPGGTFLRDYDGVTYLGSGNPASVSTFALDRFEVTVGRFRSFVAAVTSGWSPAAGAGKHTHLGGGQGLSQPKGMSSIHEPGWDAAWSTQLPKSGGAWTKNLSCNDAHQTWTPDISGVETLAINCETWFEAYAFCIWDGGFLPSEAEWTYAASGGSEQRTYAWSSPPMSSSIDCTLANFGGAMWPSTACVAGGVNRVGSEPKGNGKWGHADLAGNVWEWNADGAGGYVMPCDDCADLDGDTKARAIRGGGFSDVAADVLGAHRLGSAPDTRDYTIGFRCARTP